MKIKWIDDIANATKFWSLKVLAALTFLTTVYLALPPEMTAKLPPEIVLVMNLLLAIVAGVSRVVDQDLPTPNAQNNESLDNRFGGGND